MQITDPQTLESRVKSERAELLEPFHAKIQKSQWCTMFGAPGSGKTTLLEKLAKRNPSIKPVGSSLSEVADQRTSLRHFFEKAFTGEKNFFFHFQMEMLLKRLTLSLPVSQIGGIIDGSICSTYGYSRSLLVTGRLSPDEYRTFYSWYLIARSILGYPSYVLYCHCSTGELSRRIEARSRPHEVNRYSVEYLTALNNSFEELASEYKQHSTIISVDTEASQSISDEEERRIITHCHSITP